MHRSGGCAGAADRALVVLAQEGKDVGDVVRVADAALGPAGLTGEDRMRANPPFGMKPTPQVLREHEVRDVVAVQVAELPSADLIRPQELEPIVLSLGMWGSKTRDLTAPGEPQPELAVLFLARRLTGLAGPLAVAIELGESDHFTVLIDGHGRASPVHGAHDAPDVQLRTDVLGLWNLFDGSVAADDLEQAGRLTIDGLPTTRRTVLNAITAPDARA